MPRLGRWYLITNLPAPGVEQQTQSDLAQAGIQEVVRLYGLRMWVEQSYRQVKLALGWSDYQVRSDPAIRRHWQLVCCASSSCWWAYGRLPTDEPPETTNDLPSATEGRGKKESQGVLAGGLEGGKGVAGALRNAETILEGVLRDAPTAGATRAA